MDLRGIIFTSFLLLGVSVNGFPMENLINKLPGQPDVTFRQFGGYIDVDDNVNGRSMFYYFVEAETDPMTRPLTIWLTGGPGCSSVGDGFSNVGPFITTKNARGLQRNLHSWNKVSNLLFIDNPIGSGWSYSNTTNDYKNDDATTNKILVAFIQRWYEKYPTLKPNDLYLAGSSYAGHFLPNLANSLLEENKVGKKTIFNVKGLIVGNPMLRQKLDILAKYDFFYYQGMINVTYYNTITTECNNIDENNYPSTFASNWTLKCDQLINEAVQVAFKATAGNYTAKKLFDAFRDPCPGMELELAQGKEVSRVSFGVDMCAQTRTQFYFNIPEVQQAFHGNRTNLPYSWRGCFTDKFKYNMADKALDMLPALKKLLQESIPITILSGDQDGICPTVGTVQHLMTLAQELNIKYTEPEDWKFGNQVAGAKLLFGDFMTFYIMNGGNHHVTSSLPPQALYLFTNFTTTK